MNRAMLELIVEICKKTPNPHPTANHPLHSPQILLTPTRPRPLQKNNSKIAAPVKSNCPHTWTRISPTFSSSSIPSYCGRPRQHPTSSRNGHPEEHEHA